jgi:acetyl esterase/lipase
MKNRRARPRPVASAFRLLALASCIPWALTARAQDASKYYTVQHAQLFKTDWTGFYRTVDAATAAVRAQFPHVLDLSYGRNAKQRLDVYMPKQKVTGAPVFLFLHGGGFREGDRAQYGYVAKPFVEKGIIVAVASYRLTDPGYVYPTQVEDVRHALGWLHKNAHAYGGDGMKLYVGGHSSGGILAADVGVDRAWMKKAGIPTEALRGMIPVSALYDLRVSDPAAADKVFWSVYAASPEQQRAASPILNIGNPTPQALVAVGSTEQHEFEDFVAGSQELVAKLNHAGVKAQFMSLEGKGHGDTALALGDSSSPLALAAIEMILGKPE